MLWGESHLGTIHWSWETPTKHRTTAHTFYQAFHVAGTRLTHAAGWDGLKLSAWCF